VSRYVGIVSDLDDFAFLKEGLNAFVFVGSLFLWRPGVCVSTAVVFSVPIHYSVDCLRFIQWLFNCDYQVRIKRPLVLDIRKLAIVDGRQNHLRAIFRIYYRYLRR